MNLVGLVWVYTGRNVVGVPDGWVFLVLLTAGLPLLIAPVLALTFAGYWSRRFSQRFTLAQRIAHVVLWLALFVTGCAIVDSTDQSGQASPITAWFGQAQLQLSRSLTLIGAAFALVAMLAVGLTLSRQRDAADGCSCREHPVGTQGRAPLGASLYRHMGWLCVMVLLSHAISFARMPVQSSLLILPALVVIVSGYRFGRRSRCLTTQQSCLVLLIWVVLLSQSSLISWWRGPALAPIGVIAGWAVVPAAWMALLSVYDAQRAGQAARRPQDTVAASDASRSQRLLWDQRRNGCCRSINARETVRDRDGS